MKRWILALTVACGCGTGSVAIPEISGNGAGNGAAAGTLAAGSPGSSAAAPVGDTGLPCDVQALLWARCVGCHSTPPSGGAPMSLQTYADLTAPSPTSPSQTAAQMSVARMQDTARPMPPAGNTPATAQEVAAMQAWVSAGTPKSSCGDSGAPAAASPYTTPTQCSSGATWTQGNQGSSAMRPGDTCISCHARTGGEAPTFTIAGTVYPTAHEPNDCNGASGTTTGATVVITDANGASFSVSVNGVGNFSSSRAVATPFRAKVVAGGRERAMSAAQTSGDCNSCHTEAGASNAPGRIMMP